MLNGVWDSLGIMFPNEYLIVSVYLSIWIYSMKLIRSQCVTSYLQYANAGKQDKLLYFYKYFNCI